MPRPRLPLSAKAVRVQICMHPAYLVKFRRYCRRYALSPGKAVQRLIDESEVAK